MAAGLGSRFGGGIKQLEPVGPNGEIIMDYSIHDAIETGYTRVIFIIRRDIEADFRAAIGDRIEDICARRGVRVDYAFQELRDLPEGYDFPEGRTKPWGTGQAVLACRDLIREPFVVINADDYYGKEAFAKLRAFLLDGSRTKRQFCMAGFILNNTLSENGGVTRGICQVDEDFRLAAVKETKHIVKVDGGAAIQEGETITPINGDSHVSMNMWGLTGEMIHILDREFRAFLERMSDPMKEEFLLPIVMDHLLQRGEVTVQVLETRDKWFGVTYREDKPLVVQSFRALIDQGVYAEDLYSK
ncbi:MAG: nucleotidyltransferase [Clostridiales bacterium]|nr:nucleotidyltransferase [Clostridiales bacterium]